MHPYKTGKWIFKSTTARIAYPFTLFSLSRCSLRIFILSSFNTLVARCMRAQPGNARLVLTHFAGVKPQISSQVMGWLVVEDTV